MTGIAKEIAKNKPNLIGLQEATILRTGISTLPITPATHIEFDMLSCVVARR